MPRYQCGRCFNVDTLTWEVYDVVDGLVQHMTPVEARIYVDNLIGNGMSEEGILETLLSTADEVEALNGTKH